MDSGYRFAHSHLVWMGSSLAIVVGGGTYFDCRALDVAKSTLLLCANLDGQLGLKGSAWQTGMAR